MNESYHTYGWVMPHAWISHITHMDESCHTYEWVTLYTWLKLCQKKSHMNIFKYAESYAYTTCVYESCSHILSTHMNELYHTYGTPYVSHIMNELHHICVTHMELHICDTAHSYVWIRYGCMTMCIHTYERVICGHLIHTYKWVISHIWNSICVTHMW